MAVFTAESAGSTGMKEYLITLDSFQPQKNSFALKTGTLALLQLKLANLRPSPPNRQQLPVWKSIQSLSTHYNHKRTHLLKKLEL